MFCLSGLLGIYGSCITLAGFCLSRHFAISGISIFKIKVQSFVMTATEPESPKPNLQPCSGTSVCDTRCMSDLTMCMVVP